MISGRPLSWERSRLMVIGCILLTVLVLLQFLFDPLSLAGNIIQLNAIRAQLPAAKELWQSQGITDYVIDVEGSVPLTCLIDATLTVEQGELVAVMGRNPLDKTSPLLPLEPADWDRPYCSYSQLLIPRMLERVERDLEETEFTAAALEVSFDPELGFVMEYAYDTCYRRGLLNPMVSECHTWYTFSNLRPSGAGGE